ncbi:MAG TPA: hypothetical protein VEI97_04695 [bacterium]|nr:hypothetical protein [bacterium]
MARSPLPDYTHSSVRAVRARERQRAKGRARAERVGLSPQAMTAILLGVLAIALIGWYLLTRPSPQERVVRRFFENVQAGRYDEAVATLEGGSFQALSERSEVRFAVLGFQKEMPLSQAIADEAEIQEELDFVPRHTGPFDFQKLKLQRDRERHRKLVQFKIRFAVTETPSVPLGPAPDKRYEYTLDGTATTVRTEGGWKVQRLEFMIVPRHPSDLQAILRFMGGEAAGGF